MSTENTSRRKKSQSDSREGRHPPPPPSPAVPVLTEAGLYFAEQVIAALAISPTTLDKWVDAGLPVAQRGNKRRFFWGRSLFVFLEENPTD